MKVLPLVLVFLAFILVKIPSIGPKISDENYLWYSAKLLADGILPYKDFFFASPPLQIGIQALLFKTIGFNIWAFKFLPIIYSIISAFFIYLSLKSSGQVKALLGVVLFLFSFVVLTTTDHDSGVHLLTMLLFASFYFSDKKPMLAGILGGLSCLVRLYALPAVLAIIVFYLFTNKTKFIKFATGFVFSFVLPMAALFLVPNFGKDIIFYHLLKTEGISKVNILSFFVRWDWLILLGFLSFIFLEKKRLSLPFLIVIFQGLFYIIFADIYYLYFIVLIPFLAIIAMQGVLTLTTKTKIDTNFAVAMVIIIAIYNSLFYLNLHAKTSRIEQLPQITSFIQNNSGKSDKIYGAYEITPLIALVAKRQILDNLVDTNAKIFLTKTVNLDERLKVLDGRVKFIITLEVVNLATGEVLRIDPIGHYEFLQGKCKIAKDYPIAKDYNYNKIVIWDCSRK